MGFSNPLSLGWCRVLAVVCLLSLVACADKDAPPQWHDECSYYIIMPIFDGTNWSYIPMCGEWERVCKWGSNYQGPKECKPE